MLINMEKRQDNLAQISTELFDLEVDLVKKIISNKELLKKFNPPSINFTDDVISLMLYNNGNFNLPFQVHKFVVSKVIHNNFFSNKNIPFSKFFNSFSERIIDNIGFDLKFNKNLDSLSKQELAQALDMLHVIYLNSEYFYEKKSLQIKKSKIAFKDRGVVYTDKRIVEDITIKTIENKLSDGSSLHDIRLMDFGCGTGRFYEYALHYLVDVKKMDKKEVIGKILYGIDIDPLAVDILRLKVLSFIKSDSLEDLQTLSRNIISKNMLITSNLENDNHLVNYNVDFKEPMNKGGFNIVLSNPPYFLLKVNKKDYDSNFTEKYYQDLSNRLEKEMAFFRDSGVYNYSIEGMLNYYRIAIEMMLNISSNEGEMGVICPSSLFADASSKKLRKHLLLKNKIREINYFAESARLFENVSQATVIFYLKKEEVTNDISIKIDNSTFKIKIDLIKKVFPDNYEIPYIEKEGWAILEKLSKWKRIKELQSIRNRRGELDLSLHKNFITNNQTGYRLVRGNMVADGKIVEKQKEFVNQDFMDRKNQEYLSKDFGKKRLICQQISNVDRKKRLNFVVSDEKDIIANSCNYLSVENEEMIQKLISILNSYLLDWRFKITSSNNHINNYELDELPIIDITTIPNEKTSISDKAKLNALICNLYGLNGEETNYILQRYIEG